ncbi:TonB-dependent receptor domain-containing protein [Pontiella agarivorans]|uniref:TonB-dependent receptor n=1 Tax=Pontiella agarivorans TaxID=3038953 RepID=A0ABU5MVM9_9BACT|nr:TonB-dependent receptor [Pontiella agarivorans]MDZ8118141.1 TonB-dependent receptor [Pontiella agarivorans]
MKTAYALPLAVYLCLPVWGDLTNSLPYHPLETIVVHGQSIRPTAYDLTQAELLDDARNLDAGHTAKTIPGISVSCASVDAPEPSIRGLGWERVTTQLDFLPIYGSCPARMDPPTVYLTPEAIENLIIVKGMPSVTYGPGGTGGRIMARTVTDPAQPALNGASAHASATYNGGRDGFSARAGGKVGDGTVEAGISANTIDFGDYESGSGQTVPGENRSYGAGATLRWTPDADNGYWFNWSGHHISHLDYPALPMDATDVDSNTITFGSRHQANRDSFQALEWQAGFSDIDHTMDNSRKPNRGIMEAKAVTESQTFGGRIATEWNFSPDTDWIIGTDGHYLTRDALRERYMVAPGTTFYDPIWPDAAQGQLGLFAERTAVFSNDQRLRLGLRFDGVDSAIGKGSEPLDPPLAAFGTVNDAYAYFYGEDARDTDRTEFLVSGNALWEIPQTDHLQWFLGAGAVQRAASVTERYYSFAPAPGGYLIGNPDLDPETKFEFNIGGYFFNEHVELSAQLFTSCVRDYILETGIASEDVNGDLTPDLIRGFVNTDAVLAGGEIDGTILLSDHWSIPFSAAYVRGRDVSEHKNLPLIPPLNGHLGVRWEWDKSVHPWAEAMLRMAAKQDRIDSRYPETETPGYQVVDLRGGIQLPGGCNLEAGIENLFDQDYTEHLSRETVLPAGDLAAGEKVPMPGRFFYASVYWTL